jgi:hypothetical protein
LASLLGTIRLRTGRAQEKKKDTGDVIGVQKFFAGTGAAKSNVALPELIYIFLN